MTPSCVKIPAASVCNVWQGHALRLSLSSIFLRGCPDIHALCWIRPPAREYSGKCYTLGLPARGLCLCAYGAAAHLRRCACCASARAAQHRTCADAHMRTMRIICAEYASAHNTRRRRIIRAHGDYLRICATAHHLRSCTCAHTLRAHLLRPCAAPFVHAALGHAAFAHARIVIQGAAEAAAGSGSPPPPSWGPGVGCSLGPCRVESAWFVVRFTMY